MYCVVYEGKETFLPLTQLRALHLSIQTQGCFFFFFFNPWKKLRGSASHYNPELLLVAKANNSLFLPISWGELFLISFTQWRKLLLNVLSACCLHLQEPYGKRMMKWYTIAHISGLGTGGQFSHYLCSGLPWILRFMLMTKRTVQ